ncbi:hypothetical protein PULV_b0273 [Pseudoalteromonas ulvae UL12]|uniref:hypothetical protein n=1 Tax=Pseudoalteromonas ulvae TaxID=107327 RepID=UPI00186BACDE|nr:hypothetical protein [Pseudoalteromonas ulvae]MBE0365653.1 hypothetical protein [Pseudoalteromonas ulvae UL12]
MQGITIKSTIATIQSGVARADGNFWATESEVTFEPFNKNSGFGPHKIERDSILKVDKCLGKGAGIVPLTSDAIEISLQDGTAFQFIISNPNEG